MTMPTIGSTLLPTALHTPTVVTDQMTFQDGNSVKSVGLDVSQDTKATSLATMHALASVWQSLKEDISSLDPDSNFTKDNTVITLPLIDMHFSHDWVLTGNWRINSGTAIYTGDNQTNTLGIPTSNITNEGYYLILIDVSRFDSGTLTLFDETEEALATVPQAPGVYAYEIYARSQDTSLFYFTATNTLPDEKIVISSIGFYRVTPRIKAYLDMKLDERGMNLTEETVKRYITEEIGDKFETQNTHIDESLSTFTGLLNEHRDDTNDPHKVTPDQIGAAYKVHTHSEFVTLGDEITHVLALLQLHLGDTESNPHGITPAMIKAAPSEHTHDTRYPSFTYVDDHIVQSIDNMKEQISSDIKDNVISAATVEKANSLTTARNITLISGVTGSVAFDGSQDVTLVATVENDSHTHNTNTVIGLDDALLKVTTDIAALDTAVTTIANKIAPYYGYVVCDTASDVQEKSITLEGYAPSVGARMTIHFVNGCSVDAPTLKINALDALPFLWCGNTLTKDNIPANIIYDVIVTDAGYVIVNTLDRSYLGT